eukprot:scaffold138461_cov74-Cyclotella_meneghiniana.AAC.2
MDDSNAKCQNMRLRGGPTVVCRFKFKSSEARSGSSDSLTLAFENLANLERTMNSRYDTAVENLRFQLAVKEAFADLHLDLSKSSASFGVSIFCQIETLQLLSTQKN